MSASPGGLGEQEAAQLLNTAFIAVKECHLNDVCHRGSQLPARSPAYLLLVSTAATSRCLHVH
jgi:hypothetical protein